MSEFKTIEVKQSVLESKDRQADEAEDHPDEDDEEGLKGGEEEGDEEDEILVSRSNLPALEYTGMNHGDYKLHIQVIARPMRFI